ncbi:MAG: c-type cytochrome [Gammaproteobacteria bacterium]|nr:c-type cytochrome [Gammaproteobacteria bacterium]
MTTAQRFAGTKAGTLALVLAACLGANASTELEEFDKALTLTADPKNGARLYRNCVACHGGEGWGDASGAYPQIAGQLPSVIIKQLADIRAGNRDNPLMRAFSSRRALGDAQSIADVAAYISQLPMTPNNGLAPGGDLVHGEAIYKRDCADCHGDHGQGDQAEHIPAIYGQHYQYLVRQFHWIRNGRRKNADPEMIEQIERFSARDISDVMAYTASLEPPQEKLAAPGWTNPDFPPQWRGWRPDTGQR